MQTQTFYRKANVSSAEAIASLKRNFPKSEIVDFDNRIAADTGEAAAANAKVGDKIYVATIRMAEFPPKDDEGESEESEPEAIDESPEGDDEADSPEAPPAFGGEDSSEEEEKPDKLSPEEETVHLLRQILDAIKGGGDLGGPEEDLALPDIGGPEAGPGGELPPPGMGGGKPPLPPPIKEKSPVGGPSFSSFNAKAGTVILVREDVDSTVTTSSIKQEAEEFWPTHRVAKIRRNGQEVIKGQTLNLPERKLAVVTLVKR